MANPILVPCPVDEWTKVATGVKKGQVEIKITTADYIKTYKDTTDPAPTGLSIGTPFHELPAEIESSVEIDVYVYCLKRDGLVEVSV